MRFEYPARFRRQVDEILVAFPDIPEALTSGSDMVKAYGEASDALGAALAGYVKQGRVVPKPSRKQPGELVVSPTPLVAAKLALCRRMQVLGVTNTDLARRLEVSEAAVRRLVDVDHESKLSKVVEALARLGQHLVIEVRDDPDLAA